MLISAIGCSHTCTNGALPCSCPEGFEIDASGFNCVDINECSSSSTNNCPDFAFCINTFGRSISSKACAIQSKTF